jgi:hypothetical protein
MEINGTNLSSLNSQYSASSEVKERLKEESREMIKEHRVLGEWKDKEGLELAQDPTLGGDIRYAVTSRNIDFLKRLQWGNLTIGELREVTHRIAELEQTMTENPNMLSGKNLSGEILDGKIIDVEA